MAESNKTKKILLGVGGGCLGLVTLCCLSGVGAVQWRKSGVESAATAHAEQFLGHVQARDWNAAFADSQYNVAYATSTPAALQRCFEDTALGDITAHECDSASLEGMFDEEADVECTVTSASRGATPVTIHVNSAVESPYLGFTWFASPSAFGATWQGECASWSGSQYFRDPPAGRVRP